MQSSGKWNVIICTNTATIRLLLSIRFIKSRWSKFQWICPAPFSIMQELQRNNQSGSFRKVIPCDFHSIFVIHNARKHRRYEAVHSLRFTDETFQFIAAFEQIEGERGI